MLTNSVWRGFIAACLVAAPMGCGAVDDGAAEERNEFFMDEPTQDDDTESVGTAEMALTSVNFSTYLGRSGDDFASAVAVDSAGNVYAVGTTNSFNGGNLDIYVSKFSPSGSLIYVVTLGGTGEETGDGIAVDSAGNVYVVGTTTSYNVSRDILVAKLNPTASALLYYTSIGGTDTELARGIAVDSTGAIYVTGKTQSTNFPTTPGMLQTTLRGNSDAFVTKLNPAGNTLVYSTYLGGTDHDEGSGIAVDAYGYAYVTGTTTSTNFPTTPGVFRTYSSGKQDVFVTELVPSGASFFYSTYLGGSDADFGQDIAVDSSYNAYLTGYTYSTNFPVSTGAFRISNAGQQDVFVSKLNAYGQGAYSTYVGGNGNDVANNIAVGNTGKAYVTGTTSSINFPTTPGAFRTTNGGAEDGFVIELNTNASALTYSTYVGGSQLDVATDVAIDTAGNVLVSGYTASTNFPTTAGAAQSTLYGGIFDTFVLKIGL